MSDPAAGLSPEQVKRFYDRIGAWQDTQAFYERPAVERMLAHADLSRARSVFELGCGTGRLAHRLLSEVLAPDARYRGVEISATMARLARRRLRPWVGRATVELLRSDALPTLDPGTLDAFFAVYVLDLLPVERLRRVLELAADGLAPGGLLCACTLGRGRHGVGRVVSDVWERVWRRWPGLVGGCRPVDVRAMLEATRWEVRHDSSLTVWGITSSVLVARRR